MDKFQSLVINVLSNETRRNNMEERLQKKGIQFKFIEAFESQNISKTEQSYLINTAEAVWKSHLICLNLAAKSSSPTLILEDDAVLHFDKQLLQKLVGIMEVEVLDFIQLGFLKINLTERFAIRIRNIYSFFTRNSLLPEFFLLFGFKEVGRASKQPWRKKLPLDFVVNDVRYGAHCYLVSPKFAARVSVLNSPAFLPADDFFVALSRAKSFKMIRLRKSYSSQDNSKSAFSDRFQLR